MCRKIDISLLILTLVLLVGISCAPQSKKPETGIQFDEEVYDFGIKDEGPNIKHEFKFTNIGRKTLKILNIKTECSCTIADNLDRSVEPGKSGKIDITFKTAGTQGEVTKKIILSTNIPERDTIVLTVKGIVRPPVAIIPKNVDLGIVYKTDKQPLTGSFEIDNNLDVPLKILDISVPDKKIKFTLTTLEQDMKYKVDFTIDPPFTGEKTIRGEFRIKTDNEKHPEIMQTYSYFIPPPIDVYPVNLNIDLDQLKGYVIPFMTSITIKSNMEKPIQIQNLKLTGGKGIKYELVEAVKNKVYQILLTIPLDFEYNKDEKISLVFSVLNDPEKKQYNVPVQFYKTEAVGIN